MTTFNTTAAQTFANKQLFTSLDVVNNMLAYIQDQQITGLRDGLKCQDLYSICDRAKRHGCYQVFGHELQMKIRVNGWSFTVVRLPIVNKVAFQLINKYGFSKWSTDVTEIDSYLLDVANDPDVLAMFNK